MERREEEEEEEEETEGGEKRIQHREEESTKSLLELIPLDLLHDILVRLQAKSVARSRCVSKLWSLITTRPGFFRSFTMFSTHRLSLLVRVKARYPDRSKKKTLFISLPQHEDPKDTSYSNVDDCQIITPCLGDYPGYHDLVSESVHGLICSGEHTGEVVVWNPTMRQHVTLPLIEPKIRFKSYFFGYDPVQEQYKVLCVSQRSSQDPLVFTLGPQGSWRAIQDSSPPHFPPRIPPFDQSDDPYDKGTCINGHVYYRADIYPNNDTKGPEKAVLMSFDVRYEKFNIISKPADATLGSILFNYHGKLAWVCDLSHSQRSCMRFWVLDDEETHEWSHISFLLPFLVYPLYEPNTEEDGLFFQGMTLDTGEFIFSDLLYFMICYDPKRERTRELIYDGFVYDEYWEEGVEREISFYPNHTESFMSLENIPHYDYNYNHDGSCLNCGLKHL